MSYKKTRGILKKYAKDDGYRPDYAALPGAIIWETMWEVQAGSGWLADELDLSEAGLVERLYGEREMESSIASGIEEALGMPKGIIMRMDKIYREDKERIENDKRRD